MSILEILFSWKLILIIIFKMIRRFFSTFVEYPTMPPNDFLPSLNYNKINGSFKTASLESLNWLYSVSPCFPVDASKITIIHEPQVFYKTLVEKCENAKSRIILASLYIGVGKLENKLITSIHDNMKRNENLKVNILLDFTRGTRGVINSKSILMPLINENDSCCVSLYHTPALRGLTKKLAPARWNELFGLQHMKLYLIDDTVIISGANLSNDYFTNRQDRYIMIENKGLANFYSNFIGKVQEFSLKVKTNGDVQLHDKWNLIPYKSAQLDFAAEARDRVRSYFDNVLEKQKYLRAAEKNIESGDGNDTWIFPLIEMGQLGIHHDSLVTKKLLSNALDYSELKLATGYFNLTQNYMDTLTNECSAKCSILMAHPNANGFQGAKGPAGGIPAAYSLIAKNFYDTLVSNGQNDRVALLEYERPGWSYHAKGLWYYLPESDLPNLTLIGSSNFGERSVNRDLETQICLVTNNKPLQERLQAECNHLYDRASIAENEITNRPVPRWVKGVVWLFKNFF